jgi:hypothetical protein
MRHAVTRLILAFAALATALSAHATFHLWEMTEIYSNEGRNSCAGTR